MRSVRKPLEGPSDLRSQLLTTAGFRLAAAVAPPAELRAESRRLVATLAGDARLLFDGRFGFPQLEDPDGGTRFASLAHGGSVAVAVVAAEPIGVDVENLGRSAHGVRRICADEELSILSGPAPIVDGTAVSPELWLWCAKEAAAKAVGLGIRTGIDRIEIQPGYDGLARVFCPVPTPLAPPADFAVRHFIFSGHLVAIAGSARALWLSHLPPCDTTREAGLADSPPSQCVGVLRLYKETHE